VGLLGRVGTVRAGLAVVIVGLSVAGPGCASSPTRGRLAVWAVGDCQSVPPEYDPLFESDVHGRSADRIDLAAAINETVSFQLVLSAPAGPDHGAFVEITEPTSAAGRIAAEYITVFEPISVKVDRSVAWMLRRWPRPAGTPEYYDALAPLRGAARVPGGASLPLWVDVKVPYGTPPGNYECHIIVTEGPQRTTELPLTLEVFPFALPAEAELAALAPLSVRPLLSRWSPSSSASLSEQLSPYDPRREQAVELIHSTARLLHDHGLSVYLDDYNPVVKVAPSGAVRVLWSDYDYLAGPLLDGSAYEDRAGARWWPLPVRRDLPDPDRYGGVDSAVFEQVFSAYVTECAEHINGFFDSSGLNRGPGPAVLALLESAEPCPEAYRAYGALAATARRAAPDLPLLTTFMPQDMSEFGWYGFVPMSAPDLVDIWAPPARYFEPQEMRRLAARGKGVWLRPDEPTYSGSLMVEAPPLDARSLAWQADAQGASALWLYPVDLWPDAGPATILDRVARAGADWLVYPGALAGQEEALPSVRLKRLRRGLQDIRYLELLRRHGRPEIARLVSETLFRFGGTEAYGDHFADSKPFAWVEDSAMWELARRLMAEHIVRALRGRRAPGDSEWAHALELEWRRLQHGCRKLRLFVEGVALRYRTPSQTQTELAAEAHVLLCNETREQIVGSLRFGKLQPVWNRAAGMDAIDGAPAAAGRVETLDPLSRLSRRMSIGLDNLPASADGHYTIPLEFNAGAAGDIRVEARLSYLVPVPVTTPIELDGDLSDWPAGVGNTAGGFRLIGSRPRLPGDRNYSDVPTQESRVYVAVDGRYLYFAFDCRDQHMDELSVGMSNFVEYDGLTPVGEDFVEIVLDPTNARTRATGDLYHLLVKANGVVLSQRGIACDPPTGPYDVWFSGAEARVRHRQQGWTAELRVPLDALPPEARDWPIWAINFARFQASLAEYSNWAGAKRHIYSPLSMGNLIWPQQYRRR
jgi:hypothetical protein